MRSDPGPEHEGPTAPQLAAAAGTFAMLASPSRLHLVSLMSSGRFDVGELELAIAALLDDPERRERMGKAGRARVLDKFSWHAVAVATAEAYERVIEEKHADR